VLYQARGLSVAARDAAKAREDLARGEKELRAAAAGFRELAGANPGEPDFRYQQALAANALAGLLSARGESAKARAQWGEAADLLRPLTEQHPGVSGYRLDLGRTLNRWACDHAMAQEHQAAAGLWKQTQAALAELVKRDPKDTAARQELAMVEFNLAQLARLGNRLDEETAAFRRAVEALEGLPAAARPSPAYRQDLSKRRRDLAEQLTVTGAPARDVDAAWNRALAAGRELAEEFPSEPQYASDRAVAAHELGKYRLEQNRPKDARSLLEEAAAAQRAALKAANVPDYRELLAAHLKLLTEVLLQLDDHAAAGAAAVELAGLKPADGPGHQAAAATLARCAALAAADPKLTDPQRQEAARGYGDRAVSELREAAKAGSKDPNELKKKEFDPLRDREDFKGLVKQLGG
jgi:hypothetical protein